MASLLKYLFRHLNDREQDIDVEILYAGRRRVTRKFELDKDGNVDDAIYAAYGDEDMGKITSCLTGYANLKLVKQGVQGGIKGRTKAHLIQVFETLTSTLVSEGSDRLVQTEDGRTACQFSYIGLPAATGGPSIGTVMTFRGVSVVVSKIEKEINDAYLRVVYTAIQATTTPAQIGDVEVQALEGAYTGLSAGAVTSTSKPARIFTYRWLVAGDGTTSAWLPITQQLAALNQYLVDESAVLKGVAFTILERKYAEKPETYKYSMEEMYSIPGSVALRADGVPYVNRKPVTRVMIHNITESYFLTEASAISGKAALTYEPLTWSYGTFSYKPTDNNPSGLLGYDSFEFSNCLGEYTLTGSNIFYNGIKVDTITGNLYSDPATVPSGDKVVFSGHKRWLGGMWKVTTINITFPA